MSRPARITVDLEALRHNLRWLCTRHGGRVLAVLKANAYGHGAAPCAAALADADGFAVAFGDEARALRAAGVQVPLLVLEGVFSVAELHAAASESWWVVVHHEEQLAMIERSALPAAALNVWLKLDSGMHRCGFGPQAFRAAHGRLMATGKVSSITLMSHFARADECDSGFTEAQIARFDRATSGLPGPRSLANSAGVLWWPGARRDWARCGIALYGAGIAPHGGLRPAMRVTSEIVATREVATGEPVGYGGRFVAARPTRVGLVAFGYADGYPRSAPHGTPVAVGGRMAPLIGRVSMDMLTVDVTDLPTASLGTEVELWGPKVPVDDVAARAGTIAYELLCNAKRAPMRYVGTPSPLEIAPEPSPCVHSAPGKLPLPGRCSHSC